MPEQASPEAVAVFTTTILQSSMEHLIASDVLLYGQANSLPLTFRQAGNYNSLAANVFYFASRMVDCVWNGELEMVASLLHVCLRGGGGGGTEVCVQR